MSKYIWLGLPLYKIGKAIPVFKIENKYTDNQDNFVISFNNTNIYKFSANFNFDVYSLKTYNLKDFQRLKDISLEDLIQYIGNEIIKAIPKKIKKVKNIITDLDFIASLATIHTIYTTIYNIDSLINMYNTIHSGYATDNELLKQIKQEMTNKYFENFVKFYMNIFNIIKSKYKDLNLSEKDILKIIEDNKSYFAIIPEFIDTFIFDYHLAMRLGDENNKERISNNVMQTLSYRIYSDIFKSLSNDIIGNKFYSELDFDKLFFESNLILSLSYSHIELINDILGFEPVVYPQIYYDEYDKIFSEPKSTKITKFIAIDKKTNEYKFEIYDFDNDINIRFSSSYLKKIGKNINFINLLEKLFKFDNKYSSIYDIGEILRLLEYHNNIIFANNIVKYENSYDKTNNSTRTSLIGKIKDWDEYFKKKEYLKNKLFEFIHNEFAKNRFDLLPIIYNEDMKYTPIMYILKSIAILSIASKFKREFEEFAEQYKKEKGINEETEIDFLNKTEDFINKFYNKLLEKNRFLYFLAKSDFTQYRQSYLLPKITTVLVNKFLINPILDKYKLTNENNRAMFKFILSFYFTNFLINEDVIKRNMEPENNNPIDTIIDKLNKVLGVDMDELINIIDNKVDYILNKVKTPFDLLEFLYTNNIFKLFDRINEKRYDIENILNADIFSGGSDTYLNSIRFKFLNTNNTFYRYIKINPFEFFSFSNLILEINKLQYNSKGVLSKKFSKLKEYVINLGKLAIYNDINNRNKKFNTICD